MSKEKSGNGPGGPEELRVPGAEARSYSGSRRGLDVHAVRESGAASAKPFVLQLKAAHAAWWRRRKSLLFHGYIYFQSGV
jgi:hypothetical protein